MAGHRKWSTVKRIKGSLDQKRGQLLSPFAQETTPAAEWRLIPTKNHGSITPTTIPEERLIELGIEAGGEDLTQGDEHHVIAPAPDPLYAVAEALENADGRHVPTHLAPTEDALAQLSH